MPEGDSVFVLARRLDRALRGRLLVRGEFRTPRLATRDLAGRTVLEHATHGKHLLTRFSGGATLHSHLLMDGSWAVLGEGKVLPRRLEPEVRVVLATDGGPTAYGLDLHRLELLPTDQEHRVVGHLGPDPLREDWDAVEAVRRLRVDPDVPLVAALLDQRRMAGLGNLWANELAFLLGRSPWTPVGDLDVERLVARAATALRHSVSSPDAYQVTTGDSRRGETHWVAGRRGRPCRRCGTKVRMVDEVPGDPRHRVTWWCPHCQPGPPRPVEGPHAPAKGALEAVAAMRAADRADPLRNPARPGPRAGSARPGSRYRSRRSGPPGPR